jgi:hypothetical protein
VIDAYAGPHQVLLLAEADHADFLTQEEKLRYGEHLAWLGNMLAIRGSGCENQFV